MPLGWAAGVYIIIHVYIIIIYGVCVDGDVGGCREIGGGAVGVGGGGQRIAGKTNYVSVCVVVGGWGEGGRIKHYKFRNSLTKN